MTSTETRERSAPDDRATDATSALAAARVNILVGGRFHAVTLLDVLARFGTDALVYTSAPRSKFRSGERQYRTSFVPLPGAIMARLTGRAMDRLDPYDNVVFDELAALKMRDCDVLHAWAGYALHSARRAKGKGAAVLLERSCPHVDFQEAIVEEEAARLEVPFRRKPKFWLERTRAEYDVADFIIVPSSYSRRTFLERGFDPAKVVTAPLDYPMLYRGRPEPKRPGGEFVVGTLGGSLLRKGFIDLLEAWQRLALPNARLLIKASERELRRSPRLARYLDAMPNVEVLGYIEDISSFYRRCDVFCLASVDDGFGQVVVEAFANGVPVVATENVGASELIPPTEAGFVVPIRSPAAIAGKLQLLHDDRELRGRMGANALAYSERAARSAGGYAESIRSVYERAISLRESRRPGGG